MQSPCAIFPSVACPPVYIFFSHYLINGMIFEKKKKKVTEQKMCVCFDFLYKISPEFLPLHEEFSYI